MSNRLKGLLVAETLAFTGAALIHKGILGASYVHSKASTAEIVIALVLASCLFIMLTMPQRARLAALAGQGFALLGTLVGIFVTLIGIGPQGSADMAFHIAVLVLLILGLTSAWRAQ